MIRILRRPDPDATATPRFFGEARLDNARDLCRQLGLEPTAAESPADIILAAWRKWGIDTPRHLLGDFAFVIVNPDRREIFGARDPLGVLPFYFHISADAVTFSTTVAGLLTAGQLDPKLDDAFVAASLWRPAFTHAGRTWLTGVRKLPGGHRLRIDESAERIDAYWTPLDAPEVRFRRDEDYVEAARALLVTAVEGRLSAPDPIGAHLSGGLDSTAIAVLAARACRRSGRAAPITFAWQPGRDMVAEDGWEHTLVRLVCDREQVETHFDATTVDDVVSVTQIDPAHHSVTIDLLHEGPNMRSAAARGVRRILSGWGGDEGLSSSAGGAATELLRDRRWRDFWTFCRRASINPIRTAASEYRHMIRSRPEPGPKSYLHANWMARRSELDDEPYERCGPRGHLHWAWRVGAMSARMESWHAYGARYHIEYVYPLLDRRVVEFAMGIPIEQHRRAGTGRWLMRRLTEGILPDAVRWHADKSDPQRIRYLTATMRAGLDRLARSFDQGKVARERLAYLDAPSFMADFTPEAIARAPRLGLFWQTINFVVGR